MATRKAFTIAGSYLAVAQGLSMILTETMAALILGVATPFLVLGGSHPYPLAAVDQPATVRIPSPRSTGTKLITISSRTLALRPCRTMSATPMPTMPSPATGVARVTRARHRR